MEARTTVGGSRQRPARQGVWAGAAYDGGTESIAAARSFAADFLARMRAEHGVTVPPSVVADTQLIVSELVTNACKFASGPCALNLEVQGSVLEITAWDTSSAMPIARAAEPGRIGQHGLEIILALCEGFDVRREPVGKRIKVRVALSQDGTFGG
ncbi:ATP-binding protein [Streptomyces sp. CA-111067]|uniref:ATP-binding protein n=1 Tax=Streptomyces sp. CA-111067 TaxID=3240046 RepID=UPI003D95CB58